MRKLWKKLARITNMYLSVLWMKTINFLVDSPFEITLKQHTNFCNQPQTNECRNN